jgi:hypothetical protein
MTDGIARLNNCAKSARRFLILTPLLFLAAGCQRDGIKVYHVAKDQEPPQQLAAPVSPADSANPAMPPGHPDIPKDAGLFPNPPPWTTSAPPTSSESAQSPLAWTKPDGWTEVPPSEMRLASFKVAGANGKQADVSIVPLPGMAGTDDANVNRWRGQVGLSDVSSDELQKSAETVEAGGQPAQLYDIAGTTGRILGVIQHRDGMAWFYKMTGDADLVGQQKPVLVEFLKSLKFAAAQPSGSPGEMPATLPPGHPAVGDMTTPAAASAPISYDGQPNWQVPAGWQEISGGQFLVAKFTLAGDGGATAAVNVSMSAGDGGGLAANVNRWRGQLGLPPVSDILTSSLDVASGKAQLVEMGGTNAQTGQPSQLIAAIVSQPDQTWFYKLMGDAKVVAGQRNAFKRFVQSAKYPDVH